MNLKELDRRVDMLMKSIGWTSVFGAAYAMRELEHKSKGLKARDSDIARWHDEAFDVAEDLEEWLERREKQDKVCSDGYEP